MVTRSLIVPVHNSMAYLHRVAAAWEELDASWEVIIVDDGSTDGSSSWLATNCPLAKVIYLKDCQGQAKARNLAVEQAKSDLLVFLDSDVFTQATTLEEMATYLERRPDLAGVFGSYCDRDPFEQSTLSRFRNFLHSFVHQRSAGPVGSFWTGLSCLRKSAFSKAGGFDVHLSGVEDVELGARLSRLGYRIWLAPQFQGFHLKRWTLGNFLRTDIFLRARPWMHYALMGRMPRRGLSLNWSDKLAPLLLLVTLACTWPWNGLAMAAYLGLNLERYSYFWARGGSRLGLIAPLYLSLYHLCCCLGGLLGLWDYFHQPTLKPPPLQVEAPQTPSSSTLESRR